MDIGLVNFTGSENAFFETLDLVLLELVIWQDKYLTNLVSLTTFDNSDNCATF